MMAKRYGRWEVIDSLGAGGQSDIFRVRNAETQASEEFALKRVRNPNRKQRFINEIEAVKRLQHPNIIRLLDHSALDSDGGNSDKQFLVMPIASWGDLEKRVGFYKDALDAVLIVAKQVANALDNAHKNGVIHRDVKPQNILFTGNDHEVWLTDFGICLISDMPRSTELGEVVGPRAFMAPELEEGGQLAVTPAADVYSLGKVIYYMLTGGTILPRERIGEPQFSAIFTKGERYAMLQKLLEQMICQLPLRLHDMKSVIERLTAIELWEQKAHLLSINQAGLAAIEKLQRQSREALKVSTENKAARETEDINRKHVSDGFQLWLRSELEKITSHIQSGGPGLSCQVRPLTEFQNESTNVSFSRDEMASQLNGLELVLEQEAGHFCVPHVLQIRLCDIRKLSVRVSFEAAPALSPEPARDLEFAFLPSYRQISPRGGRQAILGGYLVDPKAPEPQQSQYRPRVPVSTPRHQVTNSFNPTINQHTRFRASEWPIITNKLSEALSNAVGVFISFVSAGASTIGP